jgi:hypothetical protein
MEDDSTKSSMAYPRKKNFHGKKPKKNYVARTITLSSFRKHHMLYQQEKTNVEKEPIIKRRTRLDKHRRKQIALSLKKFSAQESSDLGNY